jgi:hypothetical protein
MNKGIRLSGFLLICAASLLGQTSAPAGTAQSQAGHLILETPASANQESTHLTNKPYLAGIEVKVKDKDDRPIPGARVEFLLPESGPGAVLPHSIGSCEGGAESGAVTTAAAKVTCVKTDDSGIAQIEGLRANKLAGAFSIRVRASFGGEITDFAQIRERNELPGFLVRNKRKLWIIGAAAAAATIAVVLLRPTPPPAATIGSVTGTGPIGAP